LREKIDIVKLLELSNSRNGIVNQNNLSWIMITVSSYDLRHLIYYYLDKLEEIAITIWS
jgi:hypothetical protein